MGRFWSLPAGWKAAFPRGLLLGALAVGGLAVVEAGSLDRLFWVEAAVLFPFVVIGATALLARRG